MSLYELVQAHGGNCGKEFSEIACAAYPLLDFDKGSGHPDSIGGVGDTEFLARFVFSPHHWDETKSEPLPALFEDIFTIGCSVQRVDLQGTEECHRHGEQFERIKQSQDKPHTYIGFANCQASVIRSIRVNREQQEVAIPDTPQTGNRWHADIVAWLPEGMTKSQRRTAKAALRVEVWRKFMQYDFSTRP